MSERERYKKPRDIIEHAKKYGAYDFHGTLDTGQADKWVKTMEQVFTMLQLSDEEKVNNVYSFMFNKVDNWLTRLKNLCGEVFIWQEFKEEFNREYLTETFLK